MPLPARRFRGGASSHIVIESCNPDFSNITYPTKADSMNRKSLLTALLIVAGFVWSTHATEKPNIVFFLADAGVSAGHSLISVIQEYGIQLCIAALAVAFAPMIIGFFWSRYVLKMNLLQTIGGVCGGMTSTPGLGIITDKTESDIPVVSYATAYPVALILMTVFAQILVPLLS